MKTWYNGKLLDDESIPVAAGGSIWRGGGWFETLALNQNNILNIDPHMNRLEDSLPVEARNQIDFDSLKNGLKKLNQRSSLENGRIKVVVWSEEDHYQTAAWIKPYNPPGRKLYESGVELSLDYRSHPPRWPQTDQKRTSYAHVVERKKSSGAWDILYCDLDGHVWETGVANLVWWEEESLLTPPFDGHVLPGTTLSSAFKRARNLGIGTDFRSTEWSNIEGPAWVTNALIGFLPVAEISGHKLRSSEGLERWNRLRDNLLSDRVIPRWH